jgi:hypothetical protein
VAIIYGFFMHRNLAEFLLLNYAWAIWVIWTMSGICLAAFSKIAWQEKQAAPVTFTTADIVNNVLGLALFICIVSLGAYLVLNLH